MTAELERGQLTAKQIDYLLRALKRERVSRDPGGNSYLPQQDVRAHLTRVFGFARWSSSVLSEALIFEEPTRSIDKKTGAPNPERFDACYKATVRLEVRDPHGRPLAHWEDVATGDAQNQTRLAAHDLALKSAVSTAFKRAATNLGDQFGLSLYNKGSLDAFIVGTLERPELAEPQRPAGTVDPPAATEEEPRAAAEDGAEETGYDGDAASNERVADHDVPHDVDQGADDPRDITPAPAADQLPTEAETREEARANIAEARRTSTPDEAPADETPPGAPTTPEPAVERPRPLTLGEELERTAAARARRNLQRRGPAINQAKARAWDALKDLYPQWTQEELVAETSDELAKMSLTTTSATTVEPWDKLTEMWEAARDDGIRNKYARAHA